MQRIQTSGCECMCFCKYGVLCLSFVHPLLHTPHLFLMVLFRVLLSLNVFTSSTSPGTSPASSTLRYSMWHRIPAWTVTQKVPWMSLSWPSYLSTGIQLFIRNLFTSWDLFTLQPKVSTRSMSLNRTSGSSSSQILWSCTAHSINI